MTAWMRDELLLENNQQYMFTLLASEALEAHYPPSPLPPPIDGTHAVQTGAFGIRPTLAFTVTVTLTLIVTVTLTRVLTLALDPPSPSPSPSPSPRYINSPGTTTEQGLLAGAESEAFAVIDTMNYVSPPIQTVLVGKAYGRLALQPDRSPSSIPSRPPASPYPSLPSPSHLAPLPGMAMLRCYSRVARRGCALRCRTRACLARPPSRALTRLPHAPNPLHPHPFTGTAP